MKICENVPMSGLKPTQKGKIGKKKIKKINKEDLRNRKKIIKSTKREIDKFDDFFSNLLEKRGENIEFVNNSSNFNFQKDYNSGIVDMVYKKDCDNQIYLKIKKDEIVLNISTPDKFDECIMFCNTNKIFKKHGAKIYELFLNYTKKRLNNFIDDFLILSDLDRQRKIKNILDDMKNI